MNRGFRIGEKHLLFFIIAAGAVLRLWRFTEIPFTHDEFSAIFRTQFSSFSELIAKGVMVDGHPAGVQVLLWLMVKLFGISEPILKAPFFLFSLFSIPLVYLIGKRWFNGTAGLISAAFMATLQFPVMYGQIARPYAAGLFVSLLMVHSWTAFIQNKATISWKTGLIFALSAAACGYIHHFAALFAVLVGITGLFLIPRKDLPRYLIFCAIAILAYLPHLPVTLAQLQTGGVEGWLRKPRFDFIADYTLYIFHFSPFIGLLLVLLAGLAITRYKRGHFHGKKLMVVAALWFILPFLAGYWYSHTVSAVLQYSVLLFSFPYILLFTGSFFTTNQIRDQLIFTALILITVIPSLIFEREHYNLFYHHPYREITQEIRNLNQHPELSGTPVLSETHPQIDSFYFNRDQFSPSHTKYIENKTNKGQLATYLNTLKTEYLAFGSLPSGAWENYSIIESYFPHLVVHKTYAGGDFFIFSKKNKENQLSEYYLDVVNDFEKPYNQWVNFKKEMLTDSLPVAGHFSYKADTSTEFSPTFEMGLREMFRNSNDVIDITAEVRLPAVFPGAWLVAAVTSRDQNVYWASTAVNDFVQPGETGKVFLSLRLSDIELRHRGLKLTVYLWNPMKLPYMIDNFRIRVRSGNPFLYGLIRPF